MIDRRSTTDDQHGGASSDYSSRAAPGEQRPRYADCDTNIIMNDHFDDDAGFWGGPDAEPTIQIERVRRGPIDRTRSHKVVKGKGGAATGGHVRARRAAASGGETPSDLSIGTRRERRDLEHPDVPSEEFEVMWADHGGSRRRAGVLGLFGVDPRLLSVGAICVAVVLAVPLFSALGGSDSPDEFRSIAAESTTTVAETTTTEVTTTTAHVATTTPPTTTEPSSNSESSNNSGSDGGSSTGGSSSSDESRAVGILSAPVDRPAAQCGNPYEVQPGDFWLGLATAVNLSLSDFLDYNESTADTPLYPGSTVCLPLGSSIAPPTTEAPATTEPSTTASTEPATTATQPPATAEPDRTEPATTEPSTTQPSTTQPSTTQPSTTQASTTRPPSGGQVEAMIREIWPEHLHDMALQVAWRESNYRPHVTSSSGCCLGVFQLHWESHRSWLDEVGISSRDDLFNAELNIRAAYVLYQRSGGWGPWSQTAY